MSRQLRKRYQYNQIPNSSHIRLLELDNGQNQIHASSQPICVRMITTDISTAPAYYALSYTWGTSKSRVLIHVNDLELPVTPSLAAGLARISSHPQFTASDASKPRGPWTQNAAKFQIRYLWIDQICINQNDDFERMHQVRQMDRIYSCSQRTIVWLGLDDRKIAESAVELLRLIEAAGFEDQKSEFRVCRTWQGRGDVDWDECERRGLPSRQNAQWQHASHFLALPWFRRVWTIQEVVLSPSDPVVICGDIQCSWTTIAWAAHWLYVENFVHYIMPQSVRCIHMVFQLRLNSASYDIGALAAMAIGHFAMDPRDNVYGLLGLRRASQDPYQNIEPLYSQTAAAACAISTRGIISSTGTLAVLSLPTMRPPACYDIWRYFGRQARWQGFRSWVVQFEDIARPRHFVKFNAVKDEKGQFSIAYHAAGRFRAAGDEPLVESSTPRVARNEPLQIQGLCVEKVRLILPTGPWEGLAKQNRSPSISGLLVGNRWWIHYLRDRRHWGMIQLIFYILMAYYLGWQRPYVLDMWECALQHGRYQEPMEAAHAVMQATTAGMRANYNAWSDDDLPLFCAFLVSLYDRWPVDKRSSRLLSAYKELVEYAGRRTTDVQEYALAMQYWCGQRRFFVTESGHVGIGPTSMRKGDAVCVLFGGGVPYILRADTNWWYFVGDCYIHDLGDGEAVEAMHRGVFEKQIFEIW